MFQNFRIFVEISFPLKIKNHPYRISVPKYVCANYYARGRAHLTMNAPFMLEHLWSYFHPRS